jgi:D-tyrosyl-tRNA(Tyr) deacylase
MKGLIQRVSSARVEVDGQSVGAIDHGILLFLGIEGDDSEQTVARLCHRVLHYRIFADEQGRMNRNLLDVEGSLLVVPQFTLAANTDKGLRPSFSSAASPEVGSALFQAFLQAAKQTLPAQRLAAGQFGMDMQVIIVNNGPVTFLL